MISSAEVLIIVVLFIFYGAAILGLVPALLRFRVPASIAIVLSFLVFGVAIGFGVARLWPSDTSVIVNIPAALIGDSIYQWSIKIIGDPSSPQAHYTIPWILRIPQAYVLASVLFWGLAGLLVQLSYNGWMRKVRHHLPHGHA